MNTELLTIETYNDGFNRVDTVFRKLFVDYPAPGGDKEPQIMVLFEDQHSGAAGEFKLPLTILTSNSIDQVPVYTVEPDGLAPVLIQVTPGLEQGDPGYVPPVQKTIGGFDVWNELIFKNSFMPLNVAFTDVVIRQKKRERGELYMPMFYVE